ncbi:MAG: 4Fe-4S dicluster domain-containing protein [Paludibacteraceae bacterium]|nr:4Fe-4S dicluster domain-containing protein [Paludibacteraceae bacterium]
MEILQYFEPFAIPFDFGTIFLFAVITYKFLKWILNLSNDNKILFARAFLPHNIFLSLKEIIQESLIHNKIFKTNTLLGYMHTSLAFGWFLLIVVGNIETKFYNGISLELPHYPIFFKYFLYREHLEYDGTSYEGYPLEGFFDVIMELLLVFVLSGVFLAYYKRFNSKKFGMKRTTKLKLGDRLAMSALWCIFPLRLLAESFNCAVFPHSPYYFITGNLGDLFANIIPAPALPHLSMMFWWMYSTSLGLFFIALPFSRYMHIITEPLLIFVRTAGVKLEKDIKEGYAQMQLNACSRCGICIDVCQLSSVSINNIQGAYFVQNLRYNDHYDPEIVNNCMMCGRCSDVCPVGVDIIGLKTNARATFNNPNFADLKYIPQPKAEQADVMYFAGCMTQLTPAIKKSMEKIFTAANIHYTFLDKDGGVCCGRPQILAGQVDAAKQLIEKNKKAILESGAKIFVTSCPICYKVFKDEYNLEGIEVLHHTQYILRLIKNGQLITNKIKKDVVYHDPCELSHNSGITNEPRELISLIADLKNPKYDKRKAVCCGGSLGSKELRPYKRSLIAKEAITTMNPNGDMLITACPLCKRTFTEPNMCEVEDVAQLVASVL